MDKLESYLQRIVEILPHEACLLRNGEIFSSNPLFAASIDKNDFMKFIGEEERKAPYPPFRSRGVLYLLTSLRLDEVYTLVFLSKRNKYALVTDPLTGVLHRECFEKISFQLIEEAEALEQTFAILFIDLDGFKAVNDTWGHESGDLVLRETADRMSRIVRDGDFCFRMGGDEFLIIMNDIKDKLHSCLLARRLITSISAPIPLSNDAHAQIGASIGIVAYPVDGVELEELLQKADAAMYRAKKLGKNNYQLHQ